MTDSNAFYSSVPVFHGFDSLMTSAHYRALPDDWWIGLTDVVQSTQAIREERYKAVNMAGAAAIAAVANALRGADFPFVFGGDGASFAVWPGAADDARAALAATAAWVRDALGLELRVALVPVTAIRAQGLDVRLARFAASPDVAFAMFSDGGMAWAEDAMKRGAHAIEPASLGTAPDLTGLSCRFEVMPATRGVILSLVVLPRSAQATGFEDVIRNIVTLVEQSPDAVSPVPPGGPALHWPSAGLEFEAQMLRRGGESAQLRRLKVYVRTLMVFLIFRLGVRIGRFTPSAYLQQVVQNSDFRKFHDGLRMVIDCTPRFADEIERHLVIAQGVAVYGMHRQDAAMMTCFTPSVYQSNHVHFIDGARGGYAAAAGALKSARR